MPLGDYKIKQDKIEAFHFTDAFNDIDKLIEFGIDNFIITSKIAGDSRSHKLDVFIGGKCKLSANLGDYIVKEAERCYKVVPKQLFEDKFVPVKAKGI